jgi:hypothetical protein
MKKTAFLLALGLLLLGNGIKAQTSMTVPHGSFEQWSSHPGYNVSFLTLSVPVYDTFSTPTGWNYLSYPVNETLPIPGMPITISTNLPLIKASRETGTVPDGTKALKLQTFMLEDLVNPNIYSLVENALDSTLTQTVFPSVLSTGEVDVETFMPIVTSLLSNMDSIGQMLSTLALMDVNELITGGIALGSFEPSRLTGSYKYHSATSGDNGAVLMLGTHYNTTTQQRDVVGGGANLSLTDIANYAPFTVDYLSLHSLDPSFPEQAPDSLIVILLSSASATMQQGSYLCIDNLVLWHDTAVVTEPDTCAAIAGLTATPDIHEAVLNWSATGTVDGYELLYGTAGFAPGSGNQLLLTNNTASLAGLAANTAYDVYVRTLCNDSIYGEWASLQFQTNPDTCAGVHDLRIEEQVVDAFPEYGMEWYSYSRVDYWEIEYGPQGFEPGNGTVVSTNEPLAVFHSHQYGNYWYCIFDIYVWESQGILQPNTEYAFYVRSVCDEGVYGEWDSVHYRTFCAKVDSIKAWDDNLSVTPDNRISGYTVTWRDTSESGHWKVEYFEVGNPSWDSVAYVDTTFFSMPALLPGTQYRVAVTSLCGGGNISFERWIRFVTPNIEGIGQAAELPLTVSPNPAHVSCTVTLPGNEPAELKLYSLDGRLLQTVTTEGSTVTLQLPAQGVFLLQATTASGTATRKIISK